MIENIQQVNTSNFNQLITYLSLNRHNISDLEREFGEKYLDNGYGSIFYLPKNTIFKKIIVQLQDNIINRFSFIGNFDISFNDIKNKYGEYREEYSFRDNLYFYFFKEIDNTFLIELILENNIDIINDKEGIKQFSIIFEK